jgi:hypothetical protein
VRPADGGQHYLLVINVMPTRLRETARARAHSAAHHLIVSGLREGRPQHRLRHGRAKTTLDTDGHLWRDGDGSARAAVGAVLAARADPSGTSTASEG